MKEEIGGYFQLELDNMEEYYPDAIKLNSARNCFKYILKAQKPKKVYVPYYIDKSMKESSLQSLTEYKYYHIDKNFEIEDNIELNDNEKLLYANYFSLKQEYIHKLKDKYGDKLVIDNTQALFEKPLQGIDTLYSVGSKFFGVPRGGLLFTSRKLNENFDYDYTYNYSKYLIGRMDLNAATFYRSYKASMKQRNNMPIKKMSKFSEAILKSINYEKIKLIRERNFIFLHYYLNNINEIKINLGNLNGPMNYPFLFKNRELRKILINNKIYVPTFWKCFIRDNNASKWEKYVSKYLLPLPVDQRYSLEDMQKIVGTIKKVVNF